MYQKARQSNLVHHNITLGTEQTKSFKAIIQEVLYPDNPEYFSAGAMASSIRTFDALKKTGGTPSELVDLMLFYVECGTQFTCDYGDIDEDFYMELETAFEDLLKLIKANNLFDTYKERLDAVVKAADDSVGWGYPDQLKDLLETEFPEAF